MKFQIFIFSIILTSVCYAKQDSLQVKLLEPLVLNGQEQVIKGEAVIEGETVQVVGKGKGEYSRQLGAIITNVAVSHIVLPGSELKLSALKKPYLTSFKTQSAAKTASLKKGQALTLNLDSSDLKEVLEKGKRGEISEAVTNVAEHTTSSDREVDLMDGSIRGGKNRKGRFGSSNQQMNSGQGSDNSHLQNGSENASYSQTQGGNQGRGEGAEGRGGRGSGASHSGSGQFGSGRHSGWANIPFRSGGTEGRGGRGSDVNNSGSNPSGSGRPSGGVNAPPGTAGQREGGARNIQNPQRTPTITAESTEEGCDPIIDNLHHRVIIQRRNIIRTDGQVTNPGTCTATLENYPIERDYRCDGCRPLVSEGDRVVYPHYKAFWVRNNGDRVYIDQTPQIDRENSYGFVEERDTCPADIDFVQDRAFPQSRFVYFDRWNTKHEIRPCARVEGHAGFPLEWTKEGCSPFHEFNNNQSKETQKAIFHVGSSIHEARRCEVTGPWLPHQFVTAQCRPILNIDGGMMTPTVRRQITTSQGPQLITEDCEPREVTHLQQTRESCEGKYFHDWQGGKSYLKKRYYFNTDGGGREFVSICVRSAEFVNHILEQRGFDHDDRAKVSKPLYAIFIEGPEGRVQIRPPQSGDNPPLPYILLREEERVSLRRPTIQGAIRSFLTDRVNVWKRADDSQFEEIVGAGVNPVLMEANFRLETERRTVPIRTERSFFRSSTAPGGGGQPSLASVTSITSGPAFGRVGRQNGSYNDFYTYKTYYAVQQREIKVYESGLREEGQWVTTGETSRIE